ncbi:MAG TPA: SOS response-associated peptidase [candidate division Zixibacteria bacterium]|nr:SOS response-associated peptidase [candidate division Zixibacteria bacterium]
MCGRFAQPRSPEELARIFQARPVSDLAGERFNVAPTDPVLAVTQRQGERLLEEFRWGLLPVFARDRRGAARMINARVETVESSPAFRTAFRARRCLLPADAFYEWIRHRDPATGRVRRSEPFAIRRKTGEPMAFAGIWSVWRDPLSAERVSTAAIITGPPNELVARVHDRMPVILPPHAWEAWLDEDAEPADLRPLLGPAPADDFVLYPVSPAVNDVRSEGPELLTPLTRWTEPETWPAAHRA